AAPQPPAASRPLTAAGHVPDDASRVVRTSAGAVRGEQEYGYRTFEGIPYAAPPTGEQRFRPPQPVQPWSGVRDATEPGSACAQIQRSRFTGSLDEDCLSLNVTTPADPNRRGRGLPVMVWIHGGSFNAGTGSEYNGGELALLGDVVVVTVNYRLGPLGFLAHPALTAEGGAGGSGNLGLQDTQAALRWVQREIAAFGGDPRRVTVFGESAGAGMVCANLVSPASAGLFSRAIAQSFSCSSTLPTQAQAEAVGLQVAARAGCADAATAAACLRALGTEELLRAGQPAGYTPVIGGALLPLQPAEALATGLYNRVPLIHGNNRDESRLFTPAVYGASITPERYEEIVRTLYGANADAVLARYPLSDYESPIVALSTLQTDAPFGWPFAVLATCEHVQAYDLLAANRGQRVYAYQFRDRTAPPWLDFPGMEEGAQHATELPYLFPGFFPEAGLTAEQERLSRGMVLYWTNFARRGNPNGFGLPTWPRYRHSHDVLGLDLRSQGGIRPVDVAAESQCDFWHDLEEGAAATGV
ncbi:MAG: carboxylesterase family protein, partial [Actinomycetota bacterium]|nr:carboxylesterase family protein [Actinomycetota bacterium]